MGIYYFVAESNRIEGIRREPTEAELGVTENFLKHSTVTLASLETFLSVCQPDARLRVGKGMNVRVGDHFPPPGGPHIHDMLVELLKDIKIADPFDFHVAYETLHPFTDGNGRSGRVLWAWQMVRKHGMDGLGLGFLHRFYYQTLSRSRRNDR